MLMASPILQIEDLSVSYGKFEALKDISLSVLPGEMFGLIGLNGAGKTTLIKTMLGLRDPDKGSILISGQERHEKEARKKFAYLPERFSPPDFLTGMEFLRFSLSLYGASKTDDDFKEAAERVALDPDALGRSVKTYSKGMRQKVGLLATILTGCELLILDEPMSGLDPKARAYVKNMLLEVKKEERTVFLSSHILSDMAEVCDHVAVIHNKGGVFDGTPQAMMDKTGHTDLEHAFLSIIDEKPKEAA